MCRKISFLNTDLDYNVPGKVSAYFGRMAVCICGGVCVFLIKLFPTKDERCGDLQEYKGRYGGGIFNSCEHPRS